MNKFLPKFQEGEVVILQSASSPDLNGEVIIHKIIYDGMEHLDRVSGQTLLAPEGYGIGYLIDPVYFQSYDKVSGGLCEIVWNESALRKKHKGSDMNFQQLMSSLNSPITREQLIENKS